MNWYQEILQVRGLTAGRIASLIPLAFGLTCIIIGRMAFVRARRKVPARSLAGIGLSLALIAVVFSIVRLTQATGAIGSGSGKLGAIVALVLGLTGIVLSGFALRRS